MTIRRRAPRSLHNWFIPKAQTAKPVDWVAPVKGWTTAVPLVAMPPDAAALMTNFFPEAGYVRPRNGSNTWTPAIGTQATGTVTFTTNPAASTTLVLDGTTWTFVSSGPTGDQILIGPNLGTGTQASGTVTFTTNPANTTTLTLNGTVWEFVTSGATGTQVNIGGTLAATLTALVAALNASTDANTELATYSATSTVLTITAVAFGTSGNSFTLATTVSGATKSGSTLSGGAFSTLYNTNVALNASADVNTALMTYRVSPTVLTITAKVGGTAGNAYTLSTTVSGATASGSTLSGGSASTSTRSLMPYSGATQKLFAVTTAGATWEVTSAGTAVSTTNAPLTNVATPVSFANFTNSAGQWLIGCTGNDAPFSYNGTTWADAGITGVTGGESTLSAVCAYRSRLWFLQKGTASLWFLATDAVTGAVSGSVNLGDVLRFGGLPVAIGVWTMEVYTGVLQFLVIMSDQGELLVYQGSDPTNTSNWSLLGSFKLGYPLGGINSMYQIGADLAIMTVDGIVPISQAISLDPAASDQASLTKNIAPTWLQTVETVGRSTNGWNFIVYPHRRMAIINVPDPALGTYQYVMNTETKAWTQFTGMSATCWASWNGNLYFGNASGLVIQADVGASDNGAPIDCLFVGAWQRLGDGLSPKLTTLIGVDAIVDSVAQVFAGVSFDYKATIPAQLASPPSGAAVALWDVAEWDQAMWPGAEPTRLIADAGGEGVIIAPTVRALISGTASTPSQCQVIGGSVHVQAGSGI